MALNFNVDPYYDDFDPAKNYHRILFKPGFAVQARELTQAQSILQDQVTKFADNIFKQNSPVTGGQVTTNLNCYYVKLQATFNNSTIDVTQFTNKLIRNLNGTVVARVIATQNNNVDPPTIVVTYMSGNHFSDNDIIYEAVLSSTPTQGLAQAIVTNATGSSSVASIAQGVFYISGNYKRPDGITISNGTFVQVNPQTIILSKYSNTPSVRVGLNILETIQDYVGDTSLLDPAIGASNYQAPGADRYQIILTLETRPLSLGDDDGFIELVRVTNGNVAKMVDGSVYNVIDDYFAKRDYETNGDYVVNDFKLTPKTNDDDTKYTMNIGKGLAYVHGYRVENSAQMDLVSNRARTTASQLNTPVYMDYGSYFYVDNLRGANASFFDITTTQTIDLHCVPLANVNVASYSAYTSTVVSSGYIRNLHYDHSNGTDANSNTFVYKVYVNNLQNSVLTANALSATTNTIVFPATYSVANSAYVGVDISITNGTNAGDFKTITAYNGVTKTATVNSDWITTPDTTSVFALNFDIKNVDTIVSVANNTSAGFSGSIYGSASINYESRKGGLVTGDTELQNPTTPELVFPVGNPYVSTIADTSYYATQVFRGVSFSGSPLTAAIAPASAFSTANVIFSGATNSPTQSSDTIKQNYTIIVTDKGINTKINVGDIIPWTSSANTSRALALDTTGKLATFTTATTDLTAFSATIIATGYVSNADTTSILKIKNLITSNTAIINSSNTAVTSNTFVDNNGLTSSGQVYIRRNDLVAPGTKQSLYISDVKRIVKIIDTKSTNYTVAPTVAMFNDASYDITNRYVFDNGQRDNFYDHASITLRAGASQPIGNILVYIDYYAHSGGDGYFSKMSYIDSATKKEDYAQIPIYASTHGKTYALRDCLDFRPTRENATTVFRFDYANSDANKKGVLIPNDLSTFTADYSYYLARKDKLILTKDKSFQIIEGSPSLQPILPQTPDGSLLIANLNHNPYTRFLPSETPQGFLPDLSIDKVQHKRYTMQDIAGLETRINQVEYYTSLNALEQNAQSLQIPDALGLNRFKNGLLVDDFSSYAAADTLSNDYRATINKRTRQLTASQDVNNFPLKSISLAYNMGKLSANAALAQHFAYNQDGYVNYFSLPYTTANIITQKLASRTVNLNPFSTPISEGVVSLSPNTDNWVDKNYSPALLITDPNLQVFRGSNTVNVLSSGDWQTISGTSSSVSYSSQSSSSSQQMNHDWSQNWGFGFGIGQELTTTNSSTTTYTTTSLLQQQNNVLGPYSSIGNTYSLNNGYITDISVLPWIRPQQIASRSYGMLTNSTLHAYFDGVNVDKYMRNANIIELTGVVGFILSSSDTSFSAFKENDVIGYYSSGGFTPVATVLGVYVYPESIYISNNVGTQVAANVRLYVAADGHSSSYATNGVLQNAIFDQNGNYEFLTAFGNVASSIHRAGIVNAVGTNTIKLSSLASSTDGSYVGNTINIVGGTGAGQSYTITSYTGATKTATVSTTVACANNDFYSMGAFTSNENGSFYGVLNIPANTFHTGERVLRIDNSAGVNPTTATSYAEGTFYASGLSVQAQQIDFGASPSGAKGTFTQTSQRTQTYTSVSVSESSVSSLSPWDPVAQTFIVDGKNYPNGIFISSAKFFFRTKPAIDKSPVSLSIVGTLNGYPNGSTLDHSVVTVTSEKINISENPHYLDSNTYTEFTFSAPIYIQPGVMYAFIIKSSSNEYALWTASNGDVAVSSSVKNLPTDELPTTITKISSAPYVGSLFISQNSQTWTAEQNQGLMFTVDRCVFDTTQTPNIQFVVPTKLPQRTLVDDSVAYFQNANSVSSSTLSNSNYLVDAFNITTTDFIPTTTGVGYSYNATLLNGAAAGVVGVNPGKYGTTMYDNIYLSDGKGERTLLANSNTSFSLYTQLVSLDPAVSPIVSDAGLSVYTVKWNINNCELSNSLITVVSGGTGYNANAISVSVSAPTGNGSSALAVANVVNGVIDHVYITNPGSGYITTPTITVSDAATRGGNSNAVITITGETSSSGGPALAKYVTKKVVLDAGFDSGDLNVYLTAYRPVNTDILVYYKILNRNDTQKFDAGQWQLMTKTNSSDTAFSQTRSDLFEYSFAPGNANIDQGYVTYTSTNGQTYTSFSQFALKIVLTSKDNTYVPFLTDMRCIALPSNVNTTV